MARVTIEDCISYYPNRFELVCLASRRARQLQDGLPEMIEYDGDKPVVQSLREMGAGHVTWDVLFDFDEQERLRLEAMAAAEDEVE
ncbi:MAG: DNA-directed RNA polymerase subunit omega [Mariprofundaceae bacterium]